MTDAVIVLNPRAIRESLDAIAELPVAKIYLRGFTEREIADTAFADALASGHDWYWVVSDDVVARPQALHALRDLREMGHPVVTGYSQRSHTEWVVNLTSGPLLADAPAAGAYEFRHFGEVVASPDPVVRTWFAGMSLTGMSAEMWRAFPFDCYETPGYGSDFSLSWRLQQAGVPIVAARDAFLYHWRHRWQDTSDDRDANPELGAREVIVEEPVGVFA